MLIGGSPMTLQTIATFNPLTVYTGAPILTLMAPFSTEGGSDKSSSSIHGVPGVLSNNCMLRMYLAVY